MLRRTLRCLFGSATLSALLSVAPLIGHGADRTQPPRRPPQRNVPAASSDFKVDQGARKLPDLRVTAFAVQQPKYVGSKLVINFTMVVKNTGDKPTGSHFFNVIRLDGKAVWSGKSEALDSEGSHRINDAVEISDPGRQWAGKTFRLVARCDARLVAGDTSVPAWALVKESNEQNNRRLSAELTAPTSPGLTTKRAAGGTRPAQRRTGRTGAPPPRVNSKAGPARASTANQSGPRRTGGYVKATLWDNREIPVSGKGPWGLLTGVPDKRILKFMRDKGVPGLTVAITKDERLVYSRAFGYANFATQIEMTPNHRSRIGSVSKIVTALAIMRLTELKDDFSLDTHVYGFDKALSNPFPTEGPFAGNGPGLGPWASEFLAADGVLDDPEYFWAIMQGTPDPGQASAYARLTVRHLLTHTSGFKVKVPGTENDTMTGSHLGFLRTNQLLYEPGTGTEYENHNLGSCGLIIVKVSGMKYEEFCRKYVLSRMDVPHMVIDGTDVGWRDSAAQVLKNGRYVVREVKPHGLDHETTGFAAGGWSATATDLVKLMCATDRSPNRIDVLHRSTLAEMEKVPFPDARISAEFGNYRPRAHGWKTNKAGVFAHDGRIKGQYQAYMAKYPPRETSRAAGYAGRTSGRPISSQHIGVNIAIAANCDVSGLDELAKELEEMLSELPVPEDLDLF